MAQRIAQVAGVPKALGMAFFFLFLSSFFLLGFGALWKYVVIDMQRDMGNHSQMQPISRFFQISFPNDANGNQAFEFEFDDVILVAIVFSFMWMRYTLTTTDIEEKERAKRKNFTFQMQKKA